MTKAKLNGYAGKALAIAIWIIIAIIGYTWHRADARVDEHETRIHKVEVCNAVIIERLTAIDDKVRELHALFFPKGEER